MEAQNRNEILARVRIKARSIERMARILSEEMMPDKQIDLRLTKKELEEYAAVIEEQLESIKGMARRLS